MMNINIPKPCHENWRAMTQKDKCRFCSSCKKDVFEITQFDEKTAQTILTDNNTCTKIEINEKGQIRTRSGFSKILFFCSTLSLGCSTETQVPPQNPSLTQENIPENTIPKEDVEKSHQLAMEQDVLEDPKPEEDCESTTQKRHTDKTSTTTTEDRTKTRVVMGKPARNNDYYEKKK